MNNHITNFFKELKYHFNFFNFKKIANQINISFIFHIKTNYRWNKKPPLFSYFYWLVVKIHKPHISKFKFNIYICLCVSIEYVLLFTFSNPYWIGFLIYYNTNSRLTLCYAQLNINHLKLFTCTFFCVLHLQNKFNYFFLEKNIARGNLIFFHFICL